MSYFKANTLVITTQFKINRICQPLPEASARVPPQFQPLSLHSKVTTILVSILLILIAPVSYKMLWFKVIFPPLKDCVVNYDF